MGRLVVNNAMSINGAFQAPQPPPGGRLVLDDDSNQVSLDQLLVAEAMVLGRKTYEGLAAVWPTLADDPAMGVMAVGDDRHRLLLAHLAHPRLPDRHRLAGLRRVRSRGR